MANLKEIERTLDIEGGYNNRKTDKGGETQWGISKRSYPDLDIKNLTREQAYGIYLKDFYNALRLGEIQSDSVRWKVFDMAVNMGQGRAARYLQRAVGVRPDGIVGDVTLAAANQMSETVLINALVDTSVLHYTAIVCEDPGQMSNLLGWMRRAINRGEA